MGIETKTGSEENQKERLSIKTGNYWTGKQTMTATFAKMIITAKSTNIFPLKQLFLSSLSNSNWACTFDRDNTIF